MVKLSKVLRIVIQVLVILVLIPIAVHLWAKLNYSWNMGVQSWELLEIANDY